MIIKKCRAKNFLAIGNAFVEIDVQKYQRLVISGVNGSGKSTLGNFIVFGLFGQTIKNITKPQIINSINGKQTLVEIELSANGNEYLIRRGIKPNVFEIIENGVPLNETLINDFQDYLERNILKTNFRTFLQTTVLSVENYKPFMSLRTPERRAFVEDILDIKVFTFMNQIVKTKIAKNREDLKLLDIQIKNTYQSAKLQKSHIDRLEELYKAGASTIETKIISLSLLLADIEIANDIMKGELEETQDLQCKLSAKSEEYKKLLKSIDKLETDIEKLQSAVIKSESDTICHACNQTLPDTIKELVLEPIKQELSDKQQKLKTLISLLSVYETIEEELTVINKQISDYNFKVSVNNTTHNTSQKEINNLEKELKQLTDSSELQELKYTLKETAKSALELKQKQADLNEDQDYNNAMIELFKDSGIKSKIIEQYIPIINGLVNQYLEKFYFFVSFNLDSEFNETIKSRHRDTFTYGSFSAGERVRIDLAILFAFRQLSKLRNAFDCNLLFLDELLDSSLDSFGILTLLDIFKDQEFDHSNIVVISHGNKDRFTEVFDGVYEISKNAQGFTQLADGSN
jgi:DNA repair exonuclease SbcCD ATPase subunit